MEVEEAVVPAKRARFLPRPHASIAQRSQGSRWRRPVQEERAMNETFDELAKVLAEDVSRREALRRVGSVLAGALLAATGLGSASGQGRGGGGGGSKGCPSGQTKCKGKCVNLQSDSQNCGSCGHGCASGQVCCSGTCTPLGTNANCAACGNACPAGSSCVNGQCSGASGCPAGQTDCGGACVDTT